MGDNTIRTEGPKLPVLLLHPWWGVSEGTRWWAEQLTQAGHPVHCPDLYDGVVLTTVEQAESHPRDEDALVARVKAAADAMPRPYAAIGFSMGAAFACLLGDRGEASPQHLALFYGGWKPDEDGVPGTERVSLHLAETDDYCDRPRSMRCTRASRRSTSSTTRARTTGSPSRVPRTTSPQRPRRLCSGCSARSADVPRSGARRSYRRRMPSTDVEVTPRLQRILTDALTLARGSGSTLVDAEHLLLAMVREPGARPTQLLEEMGVRRALESRLADALVADEQVETLEQALSRLTQE